MGPSRPPDPMPLNLMIVPWHPSALVRAITLDGSIQRRCASGRSTTLIAWVVELAEASWHLLYEFAERYELGCFAQPSDDLDTRGGQP